MTIEHSPICQRFGCNEFAGRNIKLCPEHQAQKRERSARDRAAPRCVVCGNQCGMMWKNEGDPNRPLCAKHLIAEQQQQREADAAIARYMALDNLKQEALKNGGNDKDVYIAFREELYRGESAERVLISLLNYIIDRKSK